MPRNETPRPPLVQLLRDVIARIPKTTTLEFPSERDRMGERRDVLLVPLRTLRVTETLVLRINASRRLRPAATAWLTIVPGFADVTEVGRVVLRNASFWKWQVHSNQAHFAG